MLVDQTGLRWFGRWFASAQMLRFALVPSRLVFVRTGSCLGCLPHWGALGPAWRTVNRKLDFASALGLCPNVRLTWTGPRLGCVASLPDHAWRGIGTRLWTCILAVQYTTMLFSTHSCRQRCHAVRGAHQTGNDGNTTPNTWSNVSTALVIGGALVALPCLAATATGFGVAGIVGGSMAAAAQSSMGSVAAGSAFATAQSLGMTGTFAAGTTYGASAFGVGAAAKVASWWNGNRNAEDDEDAAAAAADDDDDNGLLITCTACGQQFPAA
jgi:Interferon-induced 6-16 family